MRVRSVDLEEIPSSGYMWEVDAPQGVMVQSTIVQPPMSTGGKRTIRFTFSTDGIYKLVTLRLKRKWEKKVEDKIDVVV